MLLCCFAVRMRCRECTGPQAGSDDASMPCLTCALMQMGQCRLQQDHAGTQRKSLIAKVWTILLGKRLPEE